MVGAVGVVVVGSEFINGWGGGKGSSKFQRRMAVLGGVGRAVVVSGAWERPVVRLHFRGLAVPHCRRLVALAMGQLRRGGLNSGIQ